MASGLDLAKLHLKTVFAQVQTFLDMHQVVSAGPFLYAFVQEVSEKECYLSVDVNITVSLEILNVSHSVCMQFCL
jgi:hypothetical protein